MQTEAIARVQAEPGPARGLRRAVFIGAGPAIGGLVYLALGLAPGGLNEEARRTAAVVVWVACWWLLESLPLGATSLLPLVVLPALGATSLRDAALPYADRVIFLFMGGFLLALSIERWNLHKRIALNTVRLVGSSPTALVGGFMLATALLSMWMSNTATTLMMLPIGMSIIHLAESRTGQPAGNFAVCLMLGIAYAASIGGIATPIGTPPNAVFLGFIDRQYDRSITFLDWVLFAAPLMLAFVPIAWLILTRVAYPVRLKVIPGGREMIDRELQSLGRLTRAERLVLMVFGGTIACWMLREPAMRLMMWEANPQWLRSAGAVLNAGVDDTTIAILGAITLFLVPVNLKEGVFLLDARIWPKVPWDILLLFGGGLSMAAAIHSTKLGDYVGGQLAALGGLPPIAILLTVTTIAVFFSEFTGNTAQANIFLPILATLAAAIGVEPFVLLVPCTLSFSLAFMMPMGTPPNALVFASGKVTIRQMAWGGFLLNLVGIALVIALAYSVMPAVLGIGPGTADVAGTP